MSIGNRLLKIRKDRGLTQENFADHLNVSHRAYCSYEMGDRQIPVAIATKLFFDFNIDFTWLLTGIGDQMLSVREADFTSAISALDRFSKEKGYNLDDASKLRMAAILADGIVRQDTD